MDKTHCNFSDHVMQPVTEYVLPTPDGPVTPEMQVTAGDQPSTVRLELRAFDPATGNRVHICPECFGKMAVKLGDKLRSA